MMAENVGENENTDWHPSQLPTLLVRSISAPNEPQEQTESSNLERYKNLRKVMLTT